MAIIDKIIRKKNFWGIYWDLRQGKIMNSWGLLKEGWKFLFLMKSNMDKNECCEMLELTIHDLIEEIKLFI